MPDDLDELEAAVREDGHMILDMDEALPLIGELRDLRRQTMLHEVAWAEILALELATWLEPALPRMGRSEAYRRLIGSVSR